jgi:hypothetical protein
LLRCRLAVRETYDAAIAGDDLCDAFDRPIPRLRRTPADSGVLERVHGHACPVVFGSLVDLSGIVSSTADDTFNGKVVDRMKREGFAIREVPADH